MTHGNKTQRYCKDNHRSFHKNRHLTAILSVAAGEMTVGTMKRQVKSDNTARFLIQSKDKLQNMDVEFRGHFSND